MQIALQLAGLIAVCLGCFIVAIWLGLVVSGLALLAIGTGMEDKGKGVDNA